MKKQDDDQKLAYLIWAENSLTYVIGRGGGWKL